MKKRDKQLRDAPYRQHRTFKVGENVKSEVKGVITVVYINVGFGRQKTARRFMVYLKRGKLPCTEIEERLTKAFGDLCID